MRIFLTLAAAGLLASCSTLPTSGPSAQNVVSEESSFARYDVVDISPAVVDILARRRPDASLSGFADFRPAVEPHISVGDALTISVFEASAGGLFSPPPSTDRFSTGSKAAVFPDQVVGRDGAITMPYAGRIQVAGRTPQQVERVIQNALEGKAIQPQVMVNVTRSLANSVTVLGEVTAGARVPLSVRGDRVLDVIATAGGVRAPVNESFIQLTRGSRTARVAMTRVTSDARQNIFIRPNDVLTIIRDPQSFIVQGAAGANAEIRFDAEGVNLAQALAKAGGLLDSRADPAGVFVFRFEPEAIARDIAPDSPLAGQGAMRPVVYRLNLREPNSLFLEQRFRIFNKDLVYISNAPFTEVHKVMQVFSTALSPAATGASLYNVVK
ncbi:sugar transporter [Rhodoblastus acidophilus]|uniref:Sugar transporter n=1 Tax=Rhodoblastus acidophilus TaxID=1074 RepID=A0A6N8DK04_RHOAC|nr:polysaccharide biosynthesis/export family protein [Rhodoblastus acidophilus]MCW2272600.1 polysaccharide export outer membrane protein [Rhodoblastus acidophilus]MTV29513.1 sugar transporter [Rhodoblastus acidophilus]